MGVVIRYKLPWDAKVLNNMIKEESDHHFGSVVEGGHGLNPFRLSTH